MFFILIFYFIMMHEYCLGMSYANLKDILDTFESKIQTALNKYEKTTNQFVNEKCQWVVNEAQLITGELSKKLDTDLVKIYTLLADQKKQLSSTNDLCSYIISGSALAEMHDEFTQIHMLKVQLLNELVHLNAYRQGVEQWRIAVDNQLSVLQQKVNNLTTLDQKVDRLEQKYVLLQHDVALVDLKSVTDQVKLFDVAMKTLYNAYVLMINQCAAELNALKNAIDEEETNLHKAMIKYKTDLENQVNSDIKKLNDDILNRLDINTKAMNDMQHVHKKTMYSMAGVCGVLFLLILYQQYQLYCLQAKIQNI